MLNRGCRTKHNQGSGATQASGQILSGGKQAQINTAPANANHQSNAIRAGISCLAVVAVLTTDESFRRRFFLPVRRRVETVVMNSLTKVADSLRESVPARGASRPRFFTTSDRTCLTSREFNRPGRKVPRASQSLRLKHSTASPALYVCSPAGK